MSSETLAATVVDGVKPNVPKTKQDLLALIQGAASGDQQQIERLLTPFLTTGERVIWAGVSAKMGLIITYNFAFLTDRRVGDLEVTPWTGDLCVEICYLQHIDATVIIQPAITLALWTWIGFAYPIWIILATLVSLVTIGPLTEFRGNFGFALFVGGAIVLSLLFMTAWTILGIPLMRRWVLRYRKSGIWFKLRGGGIGSFIFADRDKFAMLTSLARMVTEQKRLLDKETL